MKANGLPDHVYAVIGKCGVKVYVDPEHYELHGLGENFNYYTTADAVPVPEPEPADEEIDKGAKYLVTIRNRRTGETLKVDIYDVLEAWKVFCSPMAHALKKLLMAGKRGVKGYDKDCDEAINSIEQSKLLQKHRK